MDQRAGGEGLDRQLRWVIFKYLVLLLVVIDDLEVRVDDVVIRLRSAPGAGRSGLSRGTRFAGRVLTLLLRGCLLVELRADSLEPLLQFFGRVFDRVNVRAILLFANIFNGVFHAFLLIGRQFITEFRELFFALIGQVVRRVARLGGFTGFPVLFGVRLSVLAELLHLVFRESAAAGDRDFLLFAGAEIFRGYVQDAVCIDVECHLNLRHTSRGRRNSIEMECPQSLIIPSHWAFALEHLDLNAGLVVAVGREDLLFSCRDGRVTRNHRGRDVARGLDRKRQRCDIEKQHVFDVASEDTPLNRGADRHHFVRIHAFMRFFPDEFPRCLDHFRHPGHTANEHELVDLAFRELGVCQTGLYRANRSFKQVVCQLLELGSGQFFLDMFRTGGIRGDEWKIDFVLLRRGERDFRLFGFFLNSLKRVGLFAYIHTGFGTELGNDPVHDLVIPVVTAQVRVTVRGFDFEDAFPDLEHGNVECTATQIVDGNFLIPLLVQPVGERGRGGFVDDSQHFETGDASGVFRRVSLRVVKVSRNGDYRLLNRFTELRFGVRFQFCQNHRRDFRRRECLAFSPDLYLNVSIAI